MGKYDYLQALPDGTTDFTIPLSLKNFVPATGGSGHVPPGKFEARVTKLAIESKKDRSGKNIHLVLETTAPGQWKGVPLHQWMAAPTTGDGADNGLQKFSQLVWSILGANGKLEKARSANEIKVSANSLIGATVYVSVRDGKDTYSDRSEIDRFISPEEYNAAPGPMGGVVSSRQEFAPEVGTNNGSQGTRAGNKDSMDDVLFA